MPNGSTVSFSLARTACLCQHWLESHSETSACKGREELSRLNSSIGWNHTPKPQPAKAVRAQQAEFHMRVIQRSLASCRSTAQA